MTIIDRTGGLRPRPTPDHRIGLCIYYYRPCTCVKRKLNSVFSFVSVSCFVYEEYRRLVLLEVLFEFLGGFVGVLENCCTRSLHIQVFSSLLSNKDAWVVVFNGALISVVYFVTETLRRLLNGDVMLIQLTSLKEVYLNLYSTTQKAFAKFMALLMVVNVRGGPPGYGSGNQTLKNSVNLDTIVGPLRKVNRAMFYKYLPLSVFKICFSTFEAHLKLNFVSSFEHSYIRYVVALHGKCRKKTSRFSTSRYSSKVV